MRTLALPALLAAALLLACGSGSVPAAGEGPPASAGAVLYERAQCVRCHGLNGTGGSMGPALSDLSANWEVEQLSAYLANPGVVLRADERLQQLGQRYIMSMPPLRTLNEADRRLLAEHLLATHP